MDQVPVVALVAELVVAQMVALVVPLLLLLLVQPAPRELLVQRSAIKLPQVVRQLLLAPQVCPLDFP